MSNSVALSGKIFGGAVLSAAAVPASGPVPTYCKVNGTLAPKLNLENSGHQGSPVDASFALTDTYAAQLFGSLSVPTVMSTTLEAVILCQYPKYPRYTANDPAAAKLAFNYACS